jgi:thiamine-phosphate pyrophosphorylase
VLDEARLYLIGDSAGLGLALEPALRAGAGIVQLRDTALSDDELLGAAATIRDACLAAGALFVLNDRADLAVEAGADGVHLGQDDGALEAARGTVGTEMLLGVSTHSPAQVDAAEAGPADYMGVGPVHETPTKPGRPAVGLDLVRHAARAASKPFFAIGGIDGSNAAEVARAGARRVAVVRAICEAPDPARAAAALLDALEVGDGAVV